MGADQIRKSFANFGGVKRRFTPAGEWNGVRIIDDYGHHPVEIEAVLKAARAMQGDNRVIAVAQPHRYSRLHDLFKDFSGCFHDADIALIAPVYAAGEDPIEGATHEALVRAIAENGHPDARAMDTLDTLPDTIRDIARPGDLIVCLGAGDITVHANALAGKLAG